MEVLPTTVLRTPYGGLGLTLCVMQAAYISTNCLRLQHQNGGTRILETGDSIMVYRTVSAAVKTQRFVMLRVLQSRRVSDVFPCPRLSGYKLNIMLKQHCNWLAGISSPSEIRLDVGIVGTARRMNFEPLV